MRSCRIVVGGPGANELADVIEVKEPALVEELIAPAAVGGFNVAFCVGVSGAI
jgi:hypothetical protein